MANHEEEPKEEKKTRKPDEQPSGREESEGKMNNEGENHGLSKPNEGSEEAEANTGKEEISEVGEKKEQYEEGQKQDLRQQIQEDLNAISKEFLKTVDGLKLTKLIEQIETRVRQENPSLQPDEKDSEEEKNSKELSLKRLVEVEVLRAMEAIRGELRTAFIQIIYAEDENQLKRFTIDLLFKIDELLKEENLTKEEAERLKNLVNRLKEIKRLSFEHNFGPSEDRFRLKSSDPNRELEYFGVVLTERSKKVAFALYNVEYFIDFLRKEGYLDEKGRFKEGEFLRLYNEIRELFEEVISMVDTKPGQYFENAFSPMYEQAYYNRLVQRLRIIGGEIRERYPNISETLISIDNPQILRYGYDPERGAETRMSYPGFRRERFDYVIGVVLAQDMSRLLNIHRVLHNAEHVVDEGYGWEELAKYIDQLSIEEVVWLFRVHPELVETYNLYLQNYIQEFALNNWVVPTSFGHKDRDNLDYAQRLTLSQLLAKKILAKKNGDQGTKEFYKTARIVRIASALTKSVTGEFWKILLISKFLISEKETKEGVGIIEHLYTGAHHGGAEKMLFMIDISALLERFNLPSEHPDIKYVYIPRDITKAKYEPWDHRRVYWVKKQLQDALVFGPSQEFLQFLKNYKLLGEALRRPTVDILDRAGWRVKEYEAFLRRTPDGKLDFNASMKNLAMVGTPAIRSFINELDFSEIDLSLITDEELRNALMNEDRDYLIARYIFGRLLSIRPSKVLTLEKRLYTPKGENLVIDELVDFFKQQYNLDSHLIKDKIFPLFLGGLELAEEIIYREKHEQAKGQYYEGSIPQNELVFYEFTKEDLTSDRVRKALGSFYEMFVRRLGIVVNYQGKRIDIEQLITKENFLATMSDFFIKIKDSIQRPREDVLDEKKGKQMVSLSQRFALWFKLGFLSGEINGEDLDYGEFLLTQAGRRVHARPFSDAASHAAKIFPNYLKIFDSIVTQIVKTKLGDAQSVIEFTVKNLVPPAKEICDTLSSYAGKEEKDKTAIQIMMLLERIVGRDSRYRMMGFGDLVMTAVRKRTGRQASLAQDAFPYHLTRPTYAPNVDQMLTMAHTFLNAMNVPFEEERTIGYEEKPVLGGLYKKPVPKKKENKYNVVQYDRIQGHSGWPRFKEKFIPIAAVIAALTIILLAISARNKQRQREK